MTMWVKNFVSRTGMLSLQKNSFVDVHKYYINELIFHIKYTSHFVI